MRRRGELRLELGQGAVRDGDALADAGRLEPLALVEDALDGPHVGFGSPGQHLGE